MKTIQPHTTATVEELVPSANVEIASQRLPMEYTFFLTPVSAQFELSGEIKHSLATLLQQICASNHWHLEFISVEPGYIQGAIRVQDTDSLAQMIQIIRAETSRNIRSEFPLTNHLSGSDLWALGHLVVAGVHPHLPKTIERFLKLTSRQSA